MKIIDQKTALKNNIKYYFTGIVCKNGHFSKRITKSYHCLECRRKTALKYAHTDKGKISRNKYKKSTKGKISNRNYRIRNKDKIQLNRQEYKRLYPEKIKAARLNWIKSDKGKLFWKIKRNSINYIITRRVRDGINYSLNLINSEKKLKTVDFIGCSIKELRQHLEMQFTNGMSWNNKGKWHIDHILPIDFFIKNFDYTKLEVQKKCWHYTNLRPLWAEENQKKSNKLIYERRCYAKEKKAS